MQQNIVRATYTVSLPGVDRPAEIVVVRGGQQCPSVGDDVMVRWELRLPADESWLLVPPIRFGSRVQVNHLYLNRDWGYEGDDDDVPHYRFVSRNVSATTWAEAFKDAVRAAADALRPLVEALHWRQAALDAANMAQVSLPSTLNDLVVIDRVVETSDE